MTEIAVVEETGSLLREQMEYARVIAKAQLLPDSYRNNPANVLIAMGLGQSMGLSPAESMYRIAVIKGKPTASAELIAANVRKAGHKLRVVGDEKSATATIIRSDDPDFEFTVTRDLAWATSMGLAKNDNYQKQPGTMLQWRAITACARLACPEALYGVVYSAEEIHEGEAVTPQRRVTSAEIAGEESQVDVAAEAATEQGDDVCPECSGDLHPPTECPGVADAGDVA